MVIVLARNWWAQAFRGVFGVAAFARPGITLGAPALWYGAVALADGLLAAAAALVGRTEGLPWWACSRRAKSASPSA